MYELDLNHYEIAGAHNLKLPYESPCHNLHGHNWYVSVHIEAEELSAHGMILDFKHIKEYLKSFDHKYINELVDFSPTAENMAKHFVDKVRELSIHEGCSPSLVKVSVQEAEHNTASYTWRA